MKKLILFAGSLIAAIFSAGQTPKLEWAKNMGGTNRDFGMSIAVDASGNVYTTGVFQGTADFDPGSATFDLTSAGKEDIFISKFDASGNFVWAKSMGGTSQEFPYSIWVDASGNVLTCGYYDGTADFDPGSGTFNLTCVNGGFISKLNSSGNFVWAIQTSGASGMSIVTDASGNIYSTGSFVGTVDFDPDVTGTFNLTSAGDGDIYILKLNASGNFVWAKNTGGPKLDMGHDIAVDASGNVYTTGIFSATADFDPGSGTFNLTSAATIDTYVSKLNASGNFVWAKNMKGYGFGLITSIEADASGNVYSSGSFTGTRDFDPGTGTFYLTSAGWDDVFISKLDAAGNFVWAKRMGGISDDDNHSMTLDASGNVYTAGVFNGTVDFDPNASKTFNLTSPLGTANIFISKLDAGGNFAWAVSIGGSAFTLVNAIKIDKSGNVYTTGEFRDTVDFDPGSSGVFNLTSAGDNNIFVHKMSQKTNGINGKSISGKVAVYPNPTAGILNIGSGILNNNETKIQVINSIGQVLIDQTPGNSDVSISIQHFPAGFYFVNVMSEGKIFARQKIIKQ